MSVTRDEARSMLAALARGRTRWLAETVPQLRAEGVWLTGSLASGTADEWSDVDIIVVGGERVLDHPLLTLTMPGNGPVGGGYVGAMYDVGAMYEVGPLPLWVDWYWWPSGAPLPRASRLVAGAGGAGNLDLSETLDLLGRGSPGPAPDPDVFALAMLPLAAKHIARGDLDKAAAMASMLNAPSDVGVGAQLSAVLSRIEGHPTATTAVRRHLDVARALTDPHRWDNPAGERRQGSD
ncbi:nucleotidyltransferase domain-containing protein [Kribbella sp. NPDC003557]|uniref:nucleotidyltransferase domain-containing protein n=1 Tax=Kribbella sp. NPDC003557 TaxID=3154449 RepID=UPI0033A296AD